MKVLFFLVALIVGVYYKLFIFGKIPFPGDLLIGSYFPWFDYYKIPVQNPLISDVFSQFFLWKHLAIDVLKNWQWPLWNPYSFTGTPLLATYHSATLYPLNILLLLPKNFGWGLYIFSQTLIASITSFLFLGLLTKNLFARLTGAMIFAFGGLMTTWLELGTAVHAMAWIPLCLYAVRRFSNTFKFKFILVLITSLVLITLAGNAQVTIYAYFLILSYCIYINLKNKFSPKIISFIFFAILVSILLSAIQLLPSLNLLQKSIRQTESYSAQANYGLLNIKDSLKFFIADYFGNDVTRNYWGNLNYPETSGFLGAITLPLLIYALFKVRNKEAIFFFILLGLSLLLTFDNPISSYIYATKIPLLTSSYASRMLFVILLAASVIAALAIDHIQNKKDSSFFQKNILWSISAISGIILGTAIVYYSVGVIYKEAPNENYLKLYLSYNDYALANFLVAAKNSLVPLSILGLLFLISLGTNKFLAKNKMNILLTAVFVLLFLDLGRYFLKFNPFVPQNLIFPDVPALQFLQKQPGIFRVGREHAEVFPPNTWIAYQIHSIEGYDPLYLNSFAKFMHFLNGGDIQSGSSSRYAELSQKYDSPYIDFANVKYFIGIGRDRNGYTPGDLINYHFNEAGYKRVFQDRSSVILENPNALERVFFAPSIITLPASEIENLIMDKTFDPRKTIALSKDLNISSVSGTGSATMAYYSPNTVRVKTESNSEQVLILTDQYEEGWKAKIDNQETPVSPANLIFRAVKVPAGTHEITFSYYPKSFEIGLKISAATLALLILGTSIVIKIKRF